MRMSVEDIPSSLSTDYENNREKSVKVHNSVNSQITLVTSLNNLNGEDNNQNIKIQQCMTEVEKTSEIMKEIIEKINSRADNLSELEETTSASLSKTTLPRNWKLFVSRTAHGFGNREPNECILL